MLIMNGGLDAYLGMPRYVLLHVCISASDPTAWGDILFAVGSFLVLLRPDPLHIALFILLVLMGAFIFTGVYQSFFVHWLFLCGQYRWSDATIAQRADHL